MAALRQAGCWAWAGNKRPIRVLVTSEATAWRAGAGCGGSACSVRKPPLPCPLATALGPALVWPPECAQQAAAEWARWTGSSPVHDGPRPWVAEAASCCGTRSPASWDGAASRGRRAGGGGAWPPEAGRWCPLTCVSGLFFFSALAAAAGPQVPLLEAVVRFQDVRGHGAAGLHPQGDCLRHIRVPPGAHRGLQK